MAKNEVSIFDANQVPDHIRKFNEEVETNITNVPKADTLTYKGKVWTVTIGGNKQVLMKKNDEGDDEPRQTINVSILDYAARRGRSYYAEGFVDGQTKAPACWSKDGIKPDDSSEEKQSDKCATCPQAVKGSKITENNTEAKACQEHKFVAVQPYRKWDLPPLRLRLAITSLYDAKNKEQEAKGWYAYDQYCEMLRARGVKHTAEVVTQMKFDMNVAYPKVLFKAAAWPSEEELEIVKDLAHSDAVKELINPVFEAVPDEAVPPKGKALPKEDPEEDDPELKPAPKPKASTKPTATTKPAPGKPKPKVVEPEPEEEAVEGEVVDEGGEDATDVTGDVEDIVEGAEEDEEEAAIREAEAKAQALRDKIAARKKAETEAAAKAANARKAAPVEPEEEETIKVAPPKTSAKPAAVTTKTNGVASAGKVTAGKPAAPKGTPAGKPAAVSKETEDTISDWD